MGVGCGWSSIEPTQVVALPSAGRGGASTGGEGLQWWVFPLGITQQWRSALVVQASSTSILVYRAPPSPLSPQDVSSQPTGVLCLGLLSRPHISAPSLCLQQWTFSGWVGRAGISTLRTGLTLSCCQTVAVFSSLSVPAELTPAPVDKNNR